MSELLRVVPEHLHLSASTVDMHADDMRTKHGTADGRVEESMAGLPAGAAAALSAKVAEWQATTGVLYGNMAGHSDGLRMGAMNYSQNDETGATNIANAGEQMPDSGL
ncbi:MULTISPECIES: type VII secretion target [Mycobacteriaceae]|jgi:hypothetical protein|uniref:Excreted virulence factor EspC, type VII ESX diderm n=1 Tax=Mycolicibacterium fluoranthenivorans TaxID=258505 RepID=A0A1G4VSE4_9MYCO|nr:MULTISPECIES: type VII secretion target [Mycobacteriaceae]MCV7251780.1 hypothetical protein [Mycobacterium hackensackense]SCX11135.1 Excreted virulence factor EspC, type VII ESX diderm [Mycolicibacterium fluoranthenivorans]